MSLLSWPLIARLAIGGTLPTPTPTTRPRAVLDTPAPGETTATRYTTPGQLDTYTPTWLQNLPSAEAEEIKARIVPGWLDAESAVITALAEAGGDLTAHRTVHLEDR